MLQMLMKRGLLEQEWRFEPDSELEMPKPIGPDSWNLSGAPRRTYLAQTQAQP